MLIVDLMPCAAASEGLSSLKVRFSSESPKSATRRRRSNAEVVLSAAGADAAFREVFRTTSFTHINLSNDGPPLRGTKKLRLEIRTDSDYRPKLCGVEVR
jgi:hypothetical protein